VPTTIQRPHVPATRRSSALWAVVAGLLLLGLVAPLVSTLEDGRRARLVVVNDSPHDLGVRIDRPGGGVLHVAHVDRATTRVIEEVLHPGGDLEVVWTREGRVVGTTRVAEGADLTPPDAVTE
jgi:hypothetical protein